MPCYHPLKAFRSQDRTIVFRETRNTVESLTLPCGQCVGCRLERSRQWAIRCAHEASLYADNCFITLTFSDEHLPEDRSVDVRIFQLFMKRLRKQYGDGIRFFHCGEYGERFGRPHYHACLFNFDFPDKYFWRISPTKNRLYRSPSLEVLWPFGHCEIGSVTFESAAYVARYVLKKFTGPQADLHYEYIDPLTGQIFDRSPEYVTMSRRPGIGKAWFEKYSSDVFPGDFVVMNGKKVRPPRYYDTQYEILYPFEMEALKHERYVNSLRFLDDNSVDRLRDKEHCQVAKLSFLTRPVE